MGFISPGKAKHWEKMCYFSPGKESWRVWLQPVSWHRRALVSSPIFGCVEFSVLWQWMLEHNCIFKSFYLFWEWGTSSICASNSLLPNSLLLLLPWQTSVLMQVQAVGLQCFTAFLFTLLQQDRKHDLFFPHNCRKKKNQVVLPMRAV